MSAPVLVAVIGPVEPPLLLAWITHYRRLGIDRFLIAFHFPDHAPLARQHDLQAVAREAGVTPHATSRGAWHEHTNTRLRDELRQAAGPGWHLIADADEFHHYPVPVGEVIASAESGGHRVVGGLLLDRVAADGRLVDWTRLGPLDRVYPLGGHLSHRLLHADPRKIVLARHHVPLASGNHRAHGYRPDVGHLVPVHHFKWRAGVLDDLQARVRHFSSSAWREDSPAVREEAGRFLDHVAHHGGVVNIADPRLAFRRVTLDETPTRWTTEARSIHATWQPPAPSRHD
ncbi:glycosyltransferase family 2 protein [Streptomyces sp. NPDC048057]|uniref:glycosyltransferase family 2 protein n=1 Tax=Streptomyces sp. NPDC048057 TaxID=3155628 RepID=UPI0033D40E07